MYLANGIKTVIYSLLVQVFAPSQALIIFAASMKTTLIASATQTETQRATLLLHSALDGYFSQLAVHIDGKHAGTLVRGETARYWLPPGMHQLVLRPQSNPQQKRLHDWRPSAAYAFQLAADAESEVFCGSDARPGLIRPVIAQALVFGLTLALLGQLQKTWFPGYAPSAWAACLRGVVAVWPGLYVKSYLQTRYWPVWIKPSAPA